MSNQDPSPPAPEDSQLVLTSSQPSSVPQQLSEEDARQIAFMAASLVQPNGAGLQGQPLQNPLSSANNSSADLQRLSTSSISAIAGELQMFCLIYKTWQISRRTHKLVDARTN